MTGGYWYDPTIKKWIRGGEQIISYLGKHLEQAHLLGISSIIHEPLLPGSGKTETVMSATGKAQRAEVVKWRDTRCAKILGTTQLDTSYYRGKSLVTSMGEQVGLNGHVIFQRSGKMSIGRICEILVSPNTGTTVERVALQHFSFGPALHPSLFLPCLELMSDEIVLTAADIVCTVNVQHNCIDSKCANMCQQRMCQEWIVTVRMKAVVEHQPTPHYFLNTYSIHNCNLIQMAIPETLRETPLRVTNPAEVRTLAVQQMRDKKSAKKVGEVPPSQEANAVEEGVQSMTKPAPAFDRAPTKSSAATKSRAKASSMRGKRKAASSIVEQAVDGPSRQQPSFSIQQNLMVPSHQFVPSQVLYHPLPLQMGPPQTSYHPPLLPLLSYPNAGPPRLQDMHLPPAHSTHAVPFPGSQPPPTTHHPHPTSSVHFMQVTPQGYHQSHYLHQPTPAQAGPQAGTMQHAVSYCMSPQHTYPQP
ncbi:uncharacterized protein F5891DRAFT_1195457 [Suillus fuscotomentosus]|uniref:Uncharacterized protein n=1 Tax=Suillus fuscotomentosus TaxID=1912939 RepID=A0AAD4HFE4_9AGAM|nr:uncharacterized protein F5891DRAFT_1195457 [Suillus fuscotomentosus]KAG1894191.1 hypothetical protein F5891DRAFT_1195457 [Suillus fuscotomentosus]